MSVRNIDAFVNQRLGTKKSRTEIYKRELRAFIYTLLKKESKELQTELNGVMLLKLNVDELHELTRYLLSGDGKTKTIFVCTREQPILVESFTRFGAKSKLFKRLHTWKDESSNWKIG